MLFMRKGRRRRKKIEQGDKGLRFDELARSDRKKKENPNNDELKLKLLRYLQWNTCVHTLSGRIHTVQLYSSPGRETYVMV